MGDNNGNYRSAVITEPNLLPPANLTGGVGSLRTPYVGNVRALAPPLPPPMQQQTQYGMGSYGGGYGGYSGYGTGYGGYNGFGGLDGYGTYGGYSGYGGAGMYNRFGGVNPMDPEMRFIQLAEASSRPAFQSIESLVSAIGNIAAMLDSTFFALTSSFRAILGVAANFGRLRGVFAQFWSTFAIFRGLNWIYRKLLYWLRISNLDPSSADFKRAYAEAINKTTEQKGAPVPARKGQSPWPVLAFLGFIFTAPYLIMKLLGTVTNTAQEEARNPAKWIHPIHTTALFDFQARNPTELTVHTGRALQIAPKEIQQTLGLLNTGWAMATVDGQTSGIIPINYVKSPQQLRQERTQQLNEDERLKLYAPSEQNYEPDTHQSSQQNTQQPEFANLSSAAFPAPPLHDATMSINAPDFDIAIQPLGPPTTAMAAFEEGFA